jgi:hypothetical protein
MRYNFAYPSFAVGVHSGWCDSNNTPTRSLIVTKRAKVYIRPYPYQIISAFDKIMPPFQVKGTSGDATGLTSGNGSTLVCYENAFFKIKRNGYRDRGFLEDKIPDRGFSLHKDGIHEKTDHEHGGSMSLEDAQREIEIENELRKNGFRIPFRTSALYKVKLPFQTDEFSVALIQRVESDFRADELCIMMLMNLFYDAAGTRFKLDLKESSFMFKDYSLNKGLHELDNGYRKMFSQIARNIGSIYRDLHKKGYIRGIDNSWYGNELICPDGHIGICDLESAFRRTEVGSAGMFKELAKTDVNLALTAFYDSMNFFENSLASFVGSTLIDGFNEGYQKQNYRKLNLNEINEQIENFVKIKKQVVIS